MTNHVVASVIHWACCCPPQGIKVSVQSTGLLCNRKRKSQMLKLILFVPLSDILPFKYEFNKKLFIIKWPLREAIY